MTTQRMKEQILKSCWPCWKSSQAWSSPERPVPYNSPHRCKAPKLSVL